MDESGGKFVHVDDNFVYRDQDELMSLVVSLFLETDE